MNKENRKDKVALVTGASTGIGRATSLFLAKKGWTVYSGVRKKKDADSLLAESDKISPIILDVTDETQILQAFKLIKENHKRLDALVNNAGVAYAGPIEAMSLEDWRKLFDVNLFAVVQLTKTFLPLLRSAQGRVVNISSVSGIMAAPFLASYAASKFALEAFSDSLRREVAHFGVRVLVIEPGPIETEIWGKGIGKVDENSQQYSDEVMTTYGKKLKSFQENIEETVKSAMPVEAVTSKIEHALYSRRPKTRYVISQKKNIFKFVTKLPDAFADKYLFNLKDNLYK